MFSVGQITLATFLGSPIAGCLLLAQNYRSLGRIKEGWQTLFVGIVSTIIAFLIGFWLPENFPSTVLPAIYTVTMHQTAKILQGNEIARYKAQGGKGSWATTVGIAVACLISIVVLAFGAMLLLVPE